MCEEGVIGEHRTTCVGVRKQECEDTWYEYEYRHGSSHCNQSEIEETALDGKVTRKVMREL